MDIARLGLAVDSSQVERGTVTLYQFTGAAGAASAAAQRLAGASQAEAAGQKAATIATQAHNAALMAQNAVIRSSMQQRTMMVYQLNDIIVSLASGMNPAMVVMQQGSQILQGGLMPALRTIGDLVGGLVTKFWPLAAVVGAVGIALAGVTHEINETSAVTVGMGDVALATFQVIAGAIYQFIQPAVELIGTWFATAWEWVVQGTKNAGNWIIRTVVGAIEYVKTSVMTLPDAFIEAGQAAAQGLSDAVAAGVNGVIGHLNNVFGAINGLAGSEVMGLIDPMSPTQIDFGGQAAGNRSRAAWQQYANTVGALGERDMMGEFFGSISARAQELARAREEVDALSGATAAANDNARALADDGLKAAADRAAELADHLGNSIGGALRGLIEGTMDFGTAMRDVLMSLAGFLGQQAAGIFGGMGGGFGFLGSILSGLFGGGFANGGVFSAGHQVHAFARGGVVDRPTLFPMANGAGLMGEAGPEAIMPLRRGPDGRLGVAANQNGGSLSVRVVSEVRGGNLVPVMTEVAGEVAGQQIRQAAPVMVGQAVGQANRSAPAAMAKYQQQRAGGDYRL